MYKKKSYSDKPPCPSKSKSFKAARASAVASYAAFNPAGSWRSIMDCSASLQLAIIWSSFHWLKVNALLRVSLKFTTASIWSWTDSGAVCGS